MSQKHRHRHRHRNRNQNNQGGQGGGGGGQNQGGPGNQNNNQGYQQHNPMNQNPGNQQQPQFNQNNNNGGGGGGGGNRLRVIVDLDEALGTPIANGAAIVGFQKRPGVDNLLEKLSRRHNLLLWSAGSKRYVDKILTFGLRRYFREIYSADELPAMWKDPRKLKADFVIDVVQEHAKAAAYGLSDKFIIITPYGDPDDERDPLAWTRQIEAILLPPLPVTQQAPQQAPQMQPQQPQQNAPIEHPIPEPIAAEIESPTGDPRA